MTIPVGVVGAAGRMGATACAAVAADPDLELVAAVAQRAAPGAAVAGLPLTAEFEELRRAGAEVVVDFTNAAAARAHLPRLAEWGVHAVVGTTGLTADDLDT